MLDLEKFIDHKRNEGPIGQPDLVRLVHLILPEVVINPNDAHPWVDLLLTSVDGLLYTGLTAEQICQMILSRSANKEYL